jgi:hypothetical protein
VSSHYRLVLLPYYVLVHAQNFIVYVQTISSGVAQASSQMVSPLASRVCYHSGFDLFLCGHKFSVACASQLRLVAGYVVS